MVDSAMFDIFLAHNSVDKLQVRTIAEELRKRGLKPWLDEEQIPPGLSFQEEIQQAISQVKSAAIFIGSEGLGRWQLLELQTLISQLINQGIPVIPVLLPGVDKIPDNLLFLQNFNWVTFENIDDAAALYKLEWGIKRVKPKLTPSLQVFEFEVVTVEAQQSREVQRSGLFGLKEQIKISSNITLNRSHSQAQYFTEDLGNGVNLDMVYIPGGKFLMGTEDEEIERLIKKYDNKWFRNEKPQHELTIQPFFMSKFLVTQAQWRAIASFPKIERDLELDPSNFKGDDLPVEQVSWDDAVEFCQRLSKMTGKEYRLPTEAEWEYACRAGATTPFHFGETITTDLANYDGNSTYANESKGKYREQTTTVGSFPPNAFGLYDMHGNVLEWCQDNWHDNYEGAPKDGSSAWLSGESIKKVIRGASWNGDPLYCRSAFRIKYSRADRYYSIGFRVVCVAPRTT